MDDAQRICICYFRPLHRSNRELGCHLCLVNHSAEFDSCNVIFLLNRMTVQQTSGEIITF